MAGRVGNFGLHVGEHQLCLAYQEQQGRVTTLAQPALMALLAQEALSESRFADEGVRYKGQRLLIGEMARQAQEWPAVRQALASCGRLDVHLALAEFALGQILHEALGPALEPAQLCVYSISAPPISPQNGQQHAFHSTILADLIRKLGYLPYPLEEGKALVVATAGNSESSTLALSFGEREINGCLSYQGIVGIDFSMDLGGDAVDQQVANALGLELAQARAIRENCRSIQVPQRREEEALAVFSHQLLGEVLARFKAFLIERGAPLFGGPIDLVWGGSWRTPDDFGLLLRREMEQAEIPIPLGQVLQTMSRETLVARGCLQVAQTLAEDRHLVAGINLR